MKVFNAAIKWLAVLAIALSAGLLVIIFLSASADFPPFLLRILILLAVAFMGGFCGRLFFHTLPALALIFLTLLTNLLAVLIIDRFYASPYQFAFITRSFSMLPPALSDISQAVIMLLVSLLPLLLLRRTRRLPPRKKIALPDWKGTWSGYSGKVKVWFASIHPKKWGIWQKLRALKKKLSARTTLKAPVQVRTAKQINPTVKVSGKKAVVKSTRQLASANKAPSKATHQATKTKQPAKLKIPTGLFGRKAHDVKLVGEEEHVCPYCLDVVSKNDSRGVKICQECGTWHHQDCWNLTGACGVAHRNEL
jgi:ribosomal protein L37AE/L43A